MNTDGRRMETGDGSKEKRKTGDRRKVAVNGIDSRSSLCTN